jgi:hypothetical protein
MGQFSVEKPVAPGSALSGNQQFDAMLGDPDPVRTLLDPDQASWVAGLAHRRLKLQEASGAFCFFPIARLLFEALLCKP